MVITAVVTAKDGRSGVVEDFLRGFKEINVCSVKESEILIVIDGESEFVEEFSQKMLANEDVISLLHHSYHFL
jgi:hypothetical protein